MVYERRCGFQSQSWFLKLLLHYSSFRYHVPRSWLKPTQNLLVLFEELGGDASKITLVERKTASVCANAHEHHPRVGNWHIENTGEATMLHQAKVHLHCAPGESISAIKFASFGTPSGKCGSFQQGTCHAETSHGILEKARTTETLKTSLHIYK